jgi:glycine/D-amino acid oxidase-like deaminating enzyme
MERADVVVVGAGLIGSAIAWRLAQAGRKVILLDRGQPGAEASTAAAGLLQPEAGREAGPQLLQLWLRSLEQYGRFVGELRETTGAAFEYRVSGRLVLALTDAEEASLQQRFRNQQAASVRCELLSGEAARKLEPAITAATRAALYFPQHGLVDNQRMSPLVTTAAALAGAQVRVDEPVLRFAETAGRVDGVATTRGQIAADVVVNAAGSWSSLLAGSAKPVVAPAKGSKGRVRARGAHPSLRAPGVHGGRLGLGPRRWAHPRWSHRARRGIQQGALSRRRGSHARGGGSRRARACSGALPGRLDRPAPAHAGRSAHYRSGSARRAVLGNRPFPDGHSLGARDGRRGGRPDRREASAGAGGRPEPTAV